MHLPRRLFRRGRPSPISPHSLEKAGAHRIPAQLTRPARLERPIGFRRITISVIALSLVAGPAPAQEDQVGDQLVQPSAVDAAAPAQASAIRKFLMLQLPVKSMSAQRLQERLDRAKSYLQLEDLSPDQRQCLENKLAELEADAFRVMRG